jgi:hypothetical protein
MKPLFPETLNLAQYFLFDRLDEGLSEKTAVEYGALSYS